MFAIILFVSASVATVYANSLTDLSGVEVDVRLDSAYPCDDNNNYPVEFSDVVVERISRNKMGLSFTTEFKESVGHDPDTTMLTLVISRCESKQKKESMQHFMTIGGNFCKYLPLKNKLWSPIVENTDGFSPICPLKEGRFAVHKAEADFENCTEAKLLPTSYWIFKTFATEGGRELFCLTVEVELKAKRPKHKPL